jgi:DNA-directed RNA polymerase specialized sigma24 family protein
MVGMNQYQGKATREGAWWVIEIPGVGVTQSRTLADAPRWAAGLVEAVTGRAGAIVQVVPVVEGVDLTELQAARSQMVQAEAAIAAASRTIRRAVRAVAAQGLTQQDTATIVGVSRQRIQQLSRTS